MLADAGMKNFIAELSQGFFLAYAQDGFGGAVDRCDFIIHVDGEHAVGYAVQYDIPFF